MTIPCRPRLFMMRLLATVLLLVLAAAAGQLKPSAQVSPKDATRVNEFYRLAPVIEDKVWLDWSKVPAPLLLVTDDAEFLTHHPNPSKVFTKVSDVFCERPRQFPPNLLATFPAFGPPSVIVVGEPENTEAKTSTPWVITLMHVHFHQLQDAQPGIFDAVNKL